MRCRRSPHAPPSPFPARFPPLDPSPWYSSCTNVCFSPFCLFGPGVLILPPRRETAGSGSPGRGAGDGWGGHSLPSTLAPGWPLQPLPVLTAVASDWPSAQGPGLISNPIFCHKTSSLSGSAASLRHFQPAKSFFQADPRVWGHLGHRGSKLLCPPPASRPAPVRELRAARLQGPCMVMHAHTCVVGASCGAGGPAPSVREQVWGWEDPGEPWDAPVWVDMWSLQCPGLLTGA